MPALAHARLGPSGAARWLNCPASVAMEAALPQERTSSEFAAEGTAAHELAERCLRTGANADDMLDMVIEADGYEFTVDRDMADYVQAYVDYVRAIEGELLVEQRVGLTRWVPESFGTADAVVFEGSTLHVVDLKYGQGVPVIAENNPQAMCYALGALDAYDFLFDIEMVSIVIHQPRLDSVSEWTISRDDLLAWGDGVLRPGAEAALSDDAPFSPGEKQCRWCAAKPICKPLAEYNLSVASEGFSVVGDPVEPTDPTTLSGAEIGEIFPQLPLIEKWIAAVREHAMAEFHQGNDIPGLKLIRKRGKTRWADEEEAGKALARKLGVKAAYVRKPISISAAKEALGKDSKLIAKHTIKPEGALAVVVASNPAPAFNLNLSEGFSEAD